MRNRSVGRGLSSRTAVAVLAVLLTPALAMADRHKAGLGGGGTSAGGSNLWGVTISGDLVVRDGPDSPKSPTSEVQHKYWMVAIAGEVTQVAGEHEGTTLSSTTLLVGPRFTLNQIRSYWRIQPFGQALVGIAYERLGEGKGSWPGSVAVGAGVDVPIGDPKANDHHPQVVGRLQGGHYWIGEGVRDSYWQFTLSVIFRLNRPPNKPTKPKS